MSFDTSNLSTEDAFQIEEEYFYPIQDNPGRIKFLHYKNGDIRAYLSAGGEGTLWSRIGSVVYVDGQWRLKLEPYATTFSLGHEAFRVITAYLHDLDRKTYEARAQKLPTWLRNVVEG